MAGDATVKSLVRAIAVLESFSTAEPELGVSEIANRLKMQKSTIHNILATFQAAGYVMKNPENSKYSLGLKVLHLGYIVNSRLGLREQFVPVMKQIANQAGEVCYLGILDEMEVLYLEAAYPSTQVQGRNILGERAPLYCTGLGKAMLAHLPQEDVDRVLSVPMKAFTRCTVTDPVVLRNELEEIRANGYAMDNMEHEFGVRCVAVPFFASNGRVMGAVSVSGPSPRFDPETVVRDAELIAGLLGPLQHCF